MAENPLEEFIFENPIEAVGFAQLRHVVTLDHELSDGAYRTFAVYIKYAQQKPTCWPSIETIAADRGKSAATVSRHNQELEALGYIRRQRRTGLTTLTVIRDLNQVPRLQELATQELQGRNHNNATCKVAIMQDVKLQKRNVKEEQSKEESQKKTTTPSAKESSPDEVVPPLPGTEEPWKGSPPPAARVFQSRMNRWPLRASYRRIHETVGDDPPDLEFWGEVVAKYRDLGWNPTNVDGMLEWYVKRKLPEVTRGNGRGGNNTLAQADAYREKLRAARERAPTVEAEYVVVGEAL